MVGEFSESVGSVGRRDPPAVAVHVPQDERFVGQVARPDERVGVAITKPCLEVGRVAYARCEQPPDVGDELLVVARVQVQGRG